MHFLVPCLFVRGSLLLFGDFLIDVEDTRDVELHAMEVISNHSPQLVQTRVTSLCNLGGAGNRTSHEMKNLFFNMLAWLGGGVPTCTICQGMSRMLRAVLRRKLPRPVMGPSLITPPPTACASPSSILLLFFLSFLCFSCSSHFFLWYRNHTSRSSCVQNRFWKVQEYFPGKSGTN